MGEGTWLLAFVTLQRVSEIVISGRNSREMLARGGVESGQSHYPVMGLVMMAWLLSLWWFGHGLAVDRFWLAVFAVLQAVRAWVMLSLGRRWTTRLIVVPGEPLVTTGPYRFMRHPNYLVVIAEIVVVPLALGLAWHAALFAVLVAGVLFVRILCEDNALALAAGTGRPAA